MKEPDKEKQKEIDYVRKQIDKDQKELLQINEDFAKLKNLRDKFSHNWRKAGIKDVTLQLL